MIRQNRSHSHRRLTQAFAAVLGLGGGIGIAGYGFSSLLAERWPSAGMCLSLSSAAYGCYIFSYFAKYGVLPAHLRRGEEAATGSDGPASMDLPAAGARDNLWFLCSPLPDNPISADHQYSLAVMKIGGTVGAAYVAFNSASLAELFNHGRKDRSVISATGLDARHFHSFGERMVLLFESADEIRSFYESGENYPCEDHLFHYSIDQGLHKK